MDPQLVEASQLFERFKAAFIRNDFNSCTDFLSQLKVLLTNFPSLPPLFQRTPNAVQELTLARDIYEHAVVLSVKTEDQVAFERDFFSVEALLYGYMWCDSAFSPAVPNLGPQPSEAPGSKQNSRIPHRTRAAPSHCIGEPLHKACC
ncbi:26S proteasome non-ATPase regulatory subunit 8-like protein A [Iris pallida]|uniref:26S proteasome non-ATPase regulatory subunit 8-like protein A n=1 Tax=Iris pallida TaxID=29817 RepID=A0AAX6EK46_IRIPA|nr:26S proteasome non-ATPase regulatory subunit 8-like protein A [Iris pallida]